MGDSLKQTLSKLEREIVKLKKEIVKVNKRLPPTREEVRKQKRDACFNGDHEWGEISGDPLDPDQDCVNCGKPCRINMTDKEWFASGMSYRSLE